jgi:hypothetical protein
MVSMGQEFLDEFREAYEEVIAEIETDMDQELGYEQVFEEGGDTFYDGQGGISINFEGNEAVIQKSPNSGFTAYDAMVMQLAEEALRRTAREWPENSGRYRFGRNPESDWSPEVREPEGAVQDIAEDLSSRGIGFESSDNQSKLTSQGENVEVVFRNQSATKRIYSEKRTVEDRIIENYFEERTKKPAS